MIFKGAVANARERSEIILASGIKLRRNYIELHRYAPRRFLPRNRIAAAIEAVTGHRGTRSRFRRAGFVVATAEELVKPSAAGCFTAELEMINATVR